MPGRRFMYVCVMLIGLILFSSEDCQETYESRHRCGSRHTNRSCKYFERNARFSLKCYNINNLDNVNSIHYRHQQDIVKIFDSNFDEIESRSFQDYLILENLTIFNSNIHNLKPGVFNGLHLLNLNLSHNSIRAISMGVFNAMYTLIALDLSKNAIRLIDNESFTGMNSLEELYLNNNELLHMPLLTDCDKLTMLDVSHNEINKLDFLIDCLQIKVLNIADNNIEYLNSNMFNGGLNNLDISRNKISSINSDTLQNLSNLEHLNLGKNPLFREMSMPIDLFRNLESLRTLNLSCTSLEKLRIGSFGALTELQILDLSFNNLTYFPEEIFHGLKSLRSLYVNNNQLLNFEYDGTAMLQEINLDGNVWNCLTLSAIIKRLNNVKIIRGTAYNTTNLFGIPCHDVAEDFPNLPASNSPNLKGFDKEYLPHVISKSVMELGNFLNQTVTNQNGQMEKKLAETLENFKNFLNGTSSYQKDYWKTLEKYQNSKYNIEEVIAKIGNAIALTQNNTESDMKQIILNFENTQIRKYWDKQNIAQDNIQQSLMDIKNILSSYKTVSQSLIGDIKYAASTEKLNLQGDNSLSRSSTIPLYFVVVILCIILTLLIVTHFRKFKRSRRDPIECNPLATLQI